MLLLIMMMFNGLVCVDSDGSDFAKDSGSSCSGVCEQYYRKKLLATLEILKNKEETIQVQGLSLEVAETRIVGLTERASALRQELDQKAKELDKLRKFADSCTIGKCDVSITAELMEVENQKNIVDTLQDNLTVIAELYRECFYETAKQEEMIDLMRQSYYEVKRMDKDKADKITRLQNVVNRQKLSIEQCQDVVTEVENLKSEISSFLNSSNNDSGMWERGSESPDVGEELGDILDQLRQLQDMLSGDCTCGLQEENNSLKEKNTNLEMRLEKLKQRVSQMREVVSNKESCDIQCQAKVEDKEREFQDIRRQLADMASVNEDKNASLEKLTRQLQQTQELLQDKSAELAEERSARVTQQDATRRLQCHLERADKRARESLEKQGENSQLKAMLEESEAQVAELEKQLQSAYERCQQLEECCRQKERSVATLAAQLQEAHAYSGALCAESGRITADVRARMRQQKALVREQQEKIARQETMLSELRCCVGAGSTHSIRTVPTETDPCCSKFLSPCSSATKTIGYSCCSKAHHSRSGSETCINPCGLPHPRSVERESEMAKCAMCASNRNETLDRLSESEMASCSSEPTPVPPRRQKKRAPCQDGYFWVSTCPRACRTPPRFAPLTPRAPPPAPAPPAPLPAPAPPAADELLRRVQRLHSALADGQRRWGKAARR